MRDRAAGIARHDPTMMRRPRVSTISIRSSPGWAQRDEVCGVAAVGGLGTTTAGTKPSTNPASDRSARSVRRQARSWGAGDAVSPRGRGDEARTGQALEHDPDLLILRPAAAPAGLDDLKQPEGAVRMPVHTHCSQRQIACAARRPSPEAPRSRGISARHTSKKLERAALTFVESRLRRKVCCRLLEYCSLSHLLSDVIS